MMICLAGDCFPVAPGTSNGLLVACLALRRDDEARGARVLGLVVVERAR